MSIKQDVKKIARAGLRNLYLQIVDYYTETIKTSNEVNPYVLSYFTLNQQDGPKLRKTPEAVAKFINEKILIQEEISSDVFDSVEKITQYLIREYEAYGIAQPPEGLLQIDYDVKEWWKQASRFQNGYFIFTDVFDYDGNGNIKRSGFNDGSPFAFNPTSSTTITDKLREYLINATKDAYLLYAGQNSFETIVDKTQMNDEYFFFLDQNKNSIKVVTDSNGKTGKVYIRTFFNEFGQKLDASLIEIQGVSELKKIPRGIRKNYIVSNLISGIDAFAKEMNKKGKPKARDAELINSLKQVKKLLEKSIKSKKLSKNSRIGFIFNTDYEFLSAVNEENELINNFELYNFLKDKTEVNRYIVRLNAINCRLVGSALGPPTTEISIPGGFNVNDYSHFGAGNQSAKSETPEEKAVNYYLERNTLENIGDAALKVVFEEVKKYVPAEVVEIYKTLFHRMDIIKMAELFASLKSSAIKISDLRKVYFRTFIEGLDITELIDCVIENAGIPQETRRITTSPALNSNGLPVPNSEVTKTITSQSNLDFELDLKTLLYGKFRYFYNLAKDFNSDLFNYPDSDNTPLPSESPDRDALTAASEQLQEKKPDIEAAIDTYKNALNVATEAQNSQQISYNEEKLLEARNELELLEQAVIDAQKDLEAFLNENFMYILMIPLSQMSQIYNTITTNDPQYKYKPELINAGMLEARDAAGFTPETFIQTLFANEIFNYAFGLEDNLFEDFYDNIAKNNKKLKTTEELKKDLESGLSKEDIAKSAKLSQTKLPKVITFDMFKLRFPTFSLDAMLSPLLRAAYDEAMKAALTPLVNATKSAMNDSYNGNEDAWDRLDPDLKAEYTSNDLEQNILDGVLSGFASPLEVYLKAKADVFPSNTIEEIQCLFRKIHSEITVQQQLKLLSNTLDEGDTSIVVIKNIFFDCGFSNDFGTITSFFVWLRELLAETGGLNLLLQKIEEARVASLLNTDLCDDNFEFLDDTLAANDSREAVKALEEVLGLLNDSKRNSLMPPIFSCADNTGRSAVLPDYYSAATKSSQDKHVKGIIDGINAVFNKDISKFKNIILKQSKEGPEEILQNLFNMSSNSTEPSAEFLDFQNKVQQAINGESVQEGVGEYESKQVDLRSILKNLFFDAVPNFQFLETTIPGVSIYRLEYTSGDFFFIYEIVTNKSNDEKEYKENILEPNSTYLVFYRKESATQEEVLLLFEDLSASLPENLQQLDLNDFYALLMTYSPLALKAGKNEILLTDYPEADLTDDKKDVLFSQRLLKYLEGKMIPGTSQLQYSEETNYSLGNEKILNPIVDSLFTSFLDQVSLFNNENFNNTPLQDNEDENYSDGGILLSDEVFKNYQDLRKLYQCFTNFESTPDANQISNLKALYKLLLNTIVTESLMKYFFILGQEKLALADDDVIKNEIITKVDNIFRTSVANIDNLAVDYRKDINMVYKFEVLENKLAAGNTLIEDPPEEWEYTDVANQINFLASEYYDKIINRINSRILVANPNLSESFDINNKTNVFNKPPSEGTGADNLFKMYDEVVFDGPVNGPDDFVIPMVAGLRGGLILQEYIDVRQNGSIIQEFIDGKLTEGYAGGENGYDYINDLALDLSVQYLPGVFINGSGLWPSLVLENGLMLGTGADSTPGYPNAFFTKVGENPSAYSISAAPELTLDIVGDVDSSEEYVPVSNPYKISWFKDFYRTQGKITKEDYIKYYSFQKDLEKKSESDPLAIPTYFAKNGPKTYYKKFSIGVQACLVVPIDDVVKANNVKTSEQLLESAHEIAMAISGKTIFGKEVFKEKFGTYSDENAKKYLVIPILRKEQDWLENLQDGWQQAKDSTWVNTMYSWVENNTSITIQNLRNAIIDDFNNTYPIGKTFAQAVPLTVVSLIENAYGEELDNMFGFTKEEILKSIRILKGVMDGEWDMNLDNMSIPEVDIYGALAFSLVPIIIKLLATFVDPTWKTPWFSPGPVGPVGYAAKILDLAT